MSDSIMHSQRVLLIPELLHNIFSFMDRDENVINACVCKQWSEVALNLVWRDVDNLLRLLFLLELCKNHRGHRFGLDRQPDPRHWTRFEKYANRVHTLRHQPDSTDYAIMHALEVVALTRVKFEILPNLRVLQWLFDGIGDLEKAMLFMHQDVRYLTISAPPIDYKYKSSFFVDIYVRMPHLHSFDLRVNYAARLIETDIVELLRGLPDLKKVTFPEFYFTSNIISQLSRMRNVNIIDFEVRKEHGDEQDVDSFVPILEEGAFPVLQSLSITARLENVTRFMNADFAPTNLTSLYINNYVEHEPQQVHMLLVALSEKCRLLSRLYIKLLHVPRQLQLIPANQITFDTLRPVLSFPNLTTFKFTHEYPVNITLEEIEELASRWPSLEVLDLNKDPLVMHHATLDLRALIPFARHCPNLRKLGLFMDATARLYSTEEWKPFTSLRRLCVGASQARSSDSVAAFLKHICPPQCEIKSGLPCPTFGGRSHCELDEGVVLELERRSTHWNRVIDILPILIQLRSDERKRTKALREELEDLRAKNHLLVAN